ncbi:MAG: hypothetical protein ACFFDN_24430 [Candidatus Hodarchaeota archaeon]
MKKEDLAIEKVVENLAKDGRSQADIGMILGFSGKDAKNWFKRLRKKYSSIQEAWEAGVAAANIQLVKTAFERAIGYEYDEIEEEFEFAGNGEYDENSDPIIVRIPTSRKVKHKKRAPDVSMLKFLLINRLPMEFKDSKDIKTKPKKETESQRQKNIAGRLISIIEAEEVKDTDFEEQENDKS